MLQVNQEKRYDVDEAMRHGWLRDSDVNRRLEMTLEDIYGPGYDDDDDMLSENMENVALNESRNENFQSKRQRLY
jgi:hypothetical protein